MGKTTIFRSFVQAQLTPCSHKIVLMNHLFPQTLLNWPLKSTWRKDGRVLPIQGWWLYLWNTWPRCMYVIFQGTLQKIGSVDFWIRSSKVANKRVLFDQSVGNMTAREELWPFCVFSHFPKDCGQVARVRARVRVFVSKCLGLAKWSTWISRYLLCASYEMEEKRVTLRLDGVFTCCFRLWLGIHASGSWFPTRVAVF